MPSAEPMPTQADDIRSAADDAGARIIPLHPRTGARADQNASGGADDMTHPPHGGTGDEAAILRPITETLELRLQARHLTLADPRTLDAVQAALEVAQAVMDGAHAQGIVDARQSAELAGLLHGVDRAACMGHEQG